VRKVLEIALGIIAAVGGFVDIGELVFNAQAGAEFGYGLLWAVPVGVLGIATYAEMCGRVATVARRPVFDVVRQRLGFGLGLFTLVASQILNLLTLAAEVGGVAFILQYLFPWSSWRRRSASSSSSGSCPSRRWSGSSATAACCCWCSSPPRITSTPTGTTWPRASSRTGRGPRYTPISSSA
jgi:Natural resistance-associated macrophage protein